MTVLNTEVTYLEQHQPAVVLGMLMLCAALDDDDQPINLTAAERYQLTL